MHIKPLADLCAKVASSFLQKPEVVFAFVLPTQCVIDLCSKSNKIYIRYMNFQGFFTHKKRLSPGFFNFFKPAHSCYRFSALSFGTWSPNLLFPTLILDYAYVNLTTNNKELFCRTQLNLHDSLYILDVFFLFFKHR